jgi:hypothetical protein
LKGNWDEKRRNPRSYHPKFLFAGFQKKAVTGKGDEKRRNPRSYHPKFRLAGV